MRGGNVAARRLGVVGTIVAVGGGTVGAEKSPSEGGWSRELAHGHRVSVVIPTLNEADNLPHVFTQLPAGLHEVVLVDGHSVDDTIEVARQLRPDIRVVLQARRGKGDALACGFAACTGDVIVMMDADGSTDPGEIPRFVQALAEGAEFAKGSRYLPGGGSADLTWLRRTGNKFLSFAVNLLYGTKYTDLCYGYNAFRRSCLESLLVDCPGFEVETLINIRVAKLGIKVAEVPSFEGERINGISNLHPVRDGFRILWVIFRERFAHLEPTAHVYEEMPQVLSLLEPTA
jgi:glycosyltransferase involved in cell wall biosynthesis